jgi:hypothetical protein
LELPTASAPLAPRRHRVVTGFTDWQSSSASGIIVSTRSSARWLGCVMVDWIDAGLGFRRTEFEERGWRVSIVISQAAGATCRYRIEISRPNGPVLRTRLGLSPSEEEAKIVALANARQMIDGVHN